jgi:peptidoglycan/LPS O-acetylase OafA/YrhL
LEFFGKIGFTFFLGAAIPMMAITKLDILPYNLNNLEKALLMFFLTIPFSWLITHYIEQPMLRLGKKIENNS